MTAPAGVSPVLFPWATIAGLLVAVWLLATLPRGEQARGGLSRWWFQLGLGLLALSLALFSEAVTRGWVLSQSHLLLAYTPWRATAPAETATFSNPLLTDAVLQGYPWLAYTCRAFSDGRLPLWVSQSYAGAPFAAPAMTAVFSPFTWAACLVPLPWATVALAVLKMVSCGLGTAALARALGANRTAAAIVAIGGTLNPFLLVWLENASDSVAAVAPWVLACTVRVCERPGGRSLALLAMVMGTMFVAGQPQTAFAVAVCAAALGLGLSAGRPLAGRALASFAAAAAAGALVAAVQVLPFVEYLRESRVYAERSGRAVNASYTPARALITAVAPDFYGNPASQPTILLANQHGQPTNYVEQIAYPGVALLVLAAVGIATARPRVAAALTGVGALALALKFGAPGVLQAVSALPLLRVSPLGRFGLVWMVVVAALAGLGLNALTASEREDGWPRRAAVAAIASVGVLATVGLVWLWAERHGLRATGLWRPTMMHAAGLLGLGAGVAGAAVLRARGTLSIAAFATLVMLALGGELIAFGRGFRPMTPPDLVSPPNAALAAIQADREVFRVAGWGSALLPNTHLPYGLSQYRGYDGMNQRRYGALLDAAVGREWDLWMDRDIQASPVLDLLNVKYLVAPPGTRGAPAHFDRLPVEGADVYVNRRALPRAWLADRHVVAAGDAALQMVVSGAVDPRTTVVLDQEIGSGVFSGAPRENPPDPIHGGGSENTPDPIFGGDGAVSITSYLDESVTIDVSAASPKWLVLTDLHYPGWVATIDGLLVSIHRANYAFRAVRVPAGRHLVRFDYRPRSVAAGAAISLATLLALGVLGWRSRS